MKVDFFRHSLGEDDAQAVANVIASPFLTTGNVCKAVEHQLIEYFRVPHAILVNSWTNGALATLLAMDIGPGDEVIVPSMTFISSANVVELAGAKTIFVDVDPKTLLVSPEEIARHVTERTRAVIPVHLYGQMCDIPGIRRILDEHPLARGHIYIIEDSAHCFEGEHKGMKPGSTSDAAIFSFYATKNVTCGEGGAIILHDNDLHRAILEARLHGMSASAVDRFAGGRYNHWDMKRLGTKANLPDILAALLPKQISTIDARLPERWKLGNNYRKAFAGGPLRLVDQIDNCRNAEHIFPVGIPNGKRDEAIFKLNSVGISVTVNFRAVHETAFYSSKYPENIGHLHEASLWGNQTLTLPMFPGMSREEQNYVIEMVYKHIYPLANTA